jgi:polyhydroxybutyrate depolymerase
MALDAACRFLLLSSALAAGCVTGKPELPVYALRQDDLERQYLLAAPDDAAKGDKLPLILALHRFTETPQVMAYSTDLHKLPEAEDVIVAFPAGRFRRWNAFGAETPDDVAFLRMVVNDVAARYPVDRERVYVVGSSLGAYMTHVAAAKAPELFAAAAAVMGSLPHPPEELGGPAGPPVPMVIIHGTADPVVRFEGPPEGLKGFWVESRPIRQAVEFWVKRNGVDPEPKVVELRDADPADETRVIREGYGEPGGPGEVVLYRVVGGGHTWPGGKEPLPRWMVGRVSRDIDATEVIWRFFQRHRRAESSKPPPLATPDETGNKHEQIGHAGDDDNGGARRQVGRVAEPDAEHGKQPAQ